MSPIPFLAVKGSAHERGVAHGRRFAREIADNIETYLRRFAASGLDRAESFVEAERWLGAIASANPAYAEEMRGIARGAGQREESVALLNARYELAFALFGKEAVREAHVRELTEAPADGCTTFGLLPQVTADGHAWLGQNWDWLEGVHGRTFVLRVERADKPAFVCLTEAGIAGGKMGINECGIGLVENGLASSADGRHPYCKPFHVRCREVLDAETLDQAMLAPFEAPRTCSANFMLGASLKSQSCRLECAWTRRSRWRGGDAVECVSLAERAPTGLNPKRHVFVAAGRAVGDAHDARIEIDQHGADGHGPPVGRLLGIGMAANAIGRIGDKRAKITFGTLQPFLRST